MKKKKTIGLLTPANEFPSEYVKIFEKLGVNYKIITNSSIYDEYTGLLCVGEKKFSKEEKIFDYLQNADKTNIPILGVGWGMEILNFFYGGKIKENITLKEQCKDFKIKHPVFLVPGAKTSFIIGGSGWVSIFSHKDRKISNNSLSPNLFASAYTSNLRIEALEKPGHHWVLGVQWSLDDQKILPAGFQNILFSFIDNSTD